MPMVAHLAAACCVWCDARAGSRTAHALLILSYPAFSSAGAPIFIDPQVAGENVVADGERARPAGFPIELATRRRRGTFQQRLPRPLETLALAPPMRCSRPRNTPSSPLRASHAPRARGAP